MKLGEALQEIKHLQSQLIRLQSRRKELFTTPVTTELEDSYVTLTIAINEIHDKIIDIKLKVMNKNLTTPVKVSIGDVDETHTLQAAILEVGRLRSELKHFEELQAQHHPMRYASMQGMSPLHRPLSKEDQEQKIRDLEIRKRKFDYAIQGANWATNLE